jgi:hypothetical protein
MECAVKGWRPDIELHRLLDTLSEEIIAAPEEEVLQACSATGRALAAVVRDVRNLIAAVNEGQEDPDPGVPLADAARRREPCIRQH